ncbi:peptidoglycan-binding domain-containing protein [Ruegeria aquimaris]|uniref:Peptidoglycan-binding protein n=1 Tax=Ruegeria aquimaris TaxID=2984333 RepID=A0ABT3ARD2_9RHOB|nr:peptidoglycan-binding domain-containing protein [Ruegeria sp. XHP0148]MCV2891238.1 peptidoglycan-binding protein [Ruegeria sp. XHP0148]
MLGVIRNMGLSATFVMFMIPPVAAEDGADTLFAQAKSLYSGSETSYSDLEQMQQIFDQIVEQYPESDLAVGILLQDTVDGLDLASFAQQIEASVPEQSEIGSDNRRNTIFDQEVAPEAAVCIATALDGIGENKLSIRVELDAGGSVSGIPELIEPNEPDTSARKLFLSAVGAIDSCAPYSIGEAGRRFVVTIVKDAVVIVEDFVEVIRAPGATLPSRSQQYPTNTDAPPVFLPAPGNLAESDAPNDLQASANVPNPGNQHSEDALQLKKADRRELQHRLRLSGHNPGGADGVFGSKSRQAISSWQRENRILPTGYFNEGQLELLKTQTEIAYQEYEKTRPKRRRVKVCGAAFLGLRSCRYEYRYYK